MARKARIFIDFEFFLVAERKSWSPLPLYWSQFPTLQQITKVVTRNFLFSCSLIVLFYVKDKVSIARDGYEVAGILKEKIGNEEGFFEFRMLKVEAYSKYSFSLHIPPLPG